MLEFVFQSILITSLVGLVFTVLLTLIKPITRKFFSSRWHYYVWLVVLIAMIAPFRFAEQFDTPQYDSYVFYSPVEKVNQNEEMLINDNAEKTKSSIFESMKFFMEDKTETLSVVWIFVSFLLFLSKLLSYGAFTVKIKRCTDVISCPELKQFTDKKIETRVSDQFSSPLMFGIFRPILLLPDTPLTEEQLNNVLSHEMIHYKRKDIAYKWFVCIVKCIHWFNPVIYYINRQVNIECEISCDAEVVKDMSEKQQTKYIDTIITLLASGNKKLSTITTGMVSDKKTLQRRFTMIMNKMKISKKAMVISIVLLLAVAGSAVFASGVLNGNLIEKPEDEIVLSKTENNQSTQIKTETGKIVYDSENGEVISAVSEPKLIPDDTAKTSSQPHETVEIEIKENEETVLEKIEFNPVDGESISLAFGKREHPITKEVKEHNGIDIKAPEGTDVVSSVTGTVTDVGYDSEKGNYVVVESGNIKTLYAQLATTNVNKGDKITAKQSIGTVGMTGNATGAHLHYEVMLDGEYVDPEAYIK